jgi:hypothetical protein
MIDLNIKPRGIITLWVLVSIVLLFLKSVGMIGLSLMIVLVFPAVGIALLLLLLLYAILEVIQGDIMYSYHKLTDPYDEEEE